MASLGPAYLIHGDDHGAVAERRARLLKVTAGAVSTETVEVLAGAKATPQALAGLLAAPSLGMGRRVIVVDGVERWRDGEVAAALDRVMCPMPPATTVALFACEETRAKAPPSLHRLVREAGGRIDHEARLRPADLLRWVVQRARGAGLDLDEDAAVALVAQVGDRRQRLERELEKLAIERRAERSRPVAVAVREIEERAARSAEVKAFALADALVAGSAAELVGTYVRLRANGERLLAMLYPLAARLRQALIAAERLERGEQAGAIARSLRMPQAAARRLVTDAGRAGSARLRRALATLADLELQSRDGPLLRADRGPGAGLVEDTLAVHALEAIGAAGG
ncbi:MAG: DNA polymerase III subunit delta [Acidobacteriota bacterium]|nr:DNA polymerase III subunit delta [Acidobacteriota bacterium]